MTNLKEKGKIEVEIKNNREVSETKSWSFEKADKIDNPLAIFIKNKKEKTQINAIRNNTR